MAGLGHGRLVELSNISVEGYVRKDPLTGKLIRVRAHRRKGLSRLLASSGAYTSGSPGSAMNWKRSGGRPRPPMLSSLGDLSAPDYTRPAVNVRADTLKPGDGVLLPHTGNEVHEVTSRRDSGDQVHLRTRSLATGIEEEHQTPKRAWWKKALFMLAAIAVLGGFVLGSAAAQGLPADLDVRDDPTISQTMNTSGDSGTDGQGIGTSAPTTAQGFQQLWDGLDDREWGGADISISTELPDGRFVWLYGDTLSYDNGLVHSSAIVQDGGTLNVSNGGAQLLPDGPEEDDRQTIYWIEKAQAQDDGTVLVHAAPMSVGTDSVWDFERADPQSRLASITVDDAGNANFEGWEGYVPAPEDSMINHGGDDAQIVGPGHYTYQGYTHDIQLEDGSYLRTLSQNWDDSLENHKNPDGSLRLSDWQPIFTSTKEAPRG